MSRPRTCPHEDRAGVGAGKFFTHSLVRNLKFNVDKAEMFLVHFTCPESLKSGPKNRSVIVLHTTSHDAKTRSPQRREFYTSSPDPHPHNTNTHTTHTHTYSLSHTHTHWGERVRKQVSERESEGRGEMDERVLLQDLESVPLIDAAQVAELEGIPGVYGETEKVSVNVNVNGILFLCCHQRGRERPLLCV